MFLRGRSERGAAAVEFALLLPILVILLGGIVDYGRYFFAQIQLANAAREGARAAIVQADPVARGNTAGGATPGWITMTTANVSPSTGCTGASPTNVTVTTNATFRFFFVNFLPGVPSSTTITANATMGCA